MDKLSSVKATSFQLTNNENYFTVCTNQGFRLHDLHTGMVKVDCDVIENGLSLCQSYNKSSLFFVVGSGNNIARPTNMLLLWDDVKKDYIAEVKFTGAILDLKVVGSWVILAEEKRLYVFNFEQDKGLDQALAEVPTKVATRG